MPFLLAGHVTGTGQPGSAFGAGEGGSVVAPLRWGLRVVRPSDARACVPGILGHPHQPHRKAQKVAEDAPQSGVPVQRGGGHRGRGRLSAQRLAGRSRMSRGVRVPLCHAVPPVRGGAPGSRGSTFAGWLPPRLLRDPCRELACVVEGTFCPQAFGSRWGCCPLLSALF